VILNAKKYNEKLDVWSVGCILAEVIGKQPILPGNDYLDQVQKIVNILGSPTEEQMSFISNESAKKYIRKIKNAKKVPLKSMFPDANNNCLDLLDKMLKFNPNERWSIQECMEHKWFKDLLAQDELYNITDNQQSEEIRFDWSVDDFEPTKHLLQKKI